MKSLFDHIPTFRRIPGFIWRLLRPLLSRKLWTRLAFIAACLVTLAVVFYTIEKWRWKGAWDKYAAKARNRGVRLYPSDFPRPHIPDAQNFGAIPYFEDYYKTPEPPDGLSGPLFAILQGDFLGGRSSGRTASGTVRELTLKKPPYPFHQKTRLTFPPKQIDLSVFSSTSTADASKGILALLDEESGTLHEQLHAAIDRPYCQFPTDLDIAETKVPKRPPFLRLRKAAQLEAMRLTLHAAAQDGDAAFEDLRVCVRLAEALKAEPFLVSAMMRVALSGLAADSVWSGLNEQVWNDETLRQIDELLSNLDLIATYRFGLETERTYFNTQCQRLVPNGMVPNGLVFRSQIKLNQFVDIACAGADLSKGTLVCDTKALDALINSSNKWQDALFLVTAPAYSRVAARTLTEEALVRQARTACALERYRLKRSSYPDTINALVAAGFLKSVPRDPANNAPMEYQRTEDGRYALKAPETDRIARETQVIQKEWPEAWMPAARK
jgi:hypothetical protein